MVLAAIHRLGNVHHAPVRWFLASLVWGGVAFYSALRLNTAIFHATGWPQRTIVDFVAPVVEEILKAVLIVYLVRSDRVTHASETLFYGFCAGIGFALLENIFYVNLGAGVEPSLIRVGSTNLMHASSTALIGLAVYRNKFPKKHHLHGWIDRHHHVAAARAALLLVLRIGLLRILVKGIVLKGVLLRAMASGERRHTTFNVLVDRPIGTGVIVSAVGLGLAFVVTMLITARRLSRAELAVATP